MKIIFCIKSFYELNGMERVLLKKIEYFKERYEILLITTDQKNKKYLNITDSKIKKIDLNINYSEYDISNFIEKVFKFLIKQKIHKKRLKKIVEEFKPDIIVSVGNEEKYFLPKIVNNSKIILEHHFERYSAFKEKRNFLYRIKDYINLKLDESLLKKYDEVIVLTKEDKKQYGSKKVKVINNSLSFYPTKIAKLENKKVISVGRLVYQKGYDILIGVWRKVVEKYPEWTLDIYGEGKLREELQQKINNYKLENHIFLKGREKNIQDKYLEASIYVMSSRYEGMPMVLVEAQACGLPVVSFDCPCGPKDIIINSENGFLCEFGNIDEMVNKIIYLIENEEERKNIGKKARENSLKFSEKKIMKKWEELFENLLKKEDRK
ncbi:glycosyltransferase family 4 protein [Fusobacterium necrogenes]|uniref:glycosyltransferase family 4 protein n=1 Tax=Fusobacterium necrogenes TaxID=858 RepID=UPI00255C6329|nr:glycosyltransferase family 4 protein [Fusobacterium necrogenes]